MSERGQERETYLGFTESIKMAFEASKQLTTLNAGAIVIIGTFLKDIFPSKHGTLTVGPFLKGLIASSFICFGVSLLLASIAMVYNARTVRTLYDVAWEDQLREKKGLPPREARRISGIAARLLLLSYFIGRRASLWPLPFFTAGLLCFGLAVVLNLYR